MESPSQHSAHPNANKTSHNSSKTRGKSKARKRASNASSIANVDDNKLPSTPLNRPASHPRVEAFSPFSHRSSQFSPNPAAQPSSPSVILFSGPADRGFERVHDATFPQNLKGLRSLARSKFRLTPSAPIELSYVNPDGIMCELDDEHDLRALAVHASLTQKLQIHVASSMPSDGPTSTHAPRLTDGEAAAAASNLAPQNITDRATAGAEKQSVPSAGPSRVSQINLASMPPPPAPVLSPANGQAKTETPTKSRRKSSKKADLSQQTPSHAGADGKIRWEDREDAASLVARLVSGSSSQVSAYGQSDQSEASQLKRAHGSQLSTPTATKASGKRKRTADSSPLPTTPGGSTGPIAASETPSTPVGPAAKKQRGRPRASAALNTPAGTNIAPETASASTGSASEPAASITVPSALAQAPDATGAASQPLESTSSSQAQISVEAPKRGRPRRSAAMAALQPGEPGAANQATQSTETPGRARAKKLVSTAGEAPGPQAPRDTRKRTGSKENTVTVAEDQNVAPTTMSQQESSPAQRSSNGNLTVAANTESEPVEAVINMQPVEASESSRSGDADVEPTPATQAAATGKPRGRPSKKALVNAKVASEVPGDAPTEEATASATNAPSQQTPPSVSQTSDQPPKKKRGRPSKADLAAKATLNTFDDDAGPAQSEGMTVSGVNAPAPPMPAKASTEEPATAPAAGGTPIKKAGRETKTSRAAMVAGAEAEPVTEHDPTAAAMAEEHTGPKEASAQEMTVSGNVDSADAAQPARNAAPTTSGDSVSVIAEAGLGISALSPGDASQAALDAVSTPTTSNRAASTAKTRASKANSTTAAAAASSDSSNVCVVCGACPSHEREGCPIWKGGSEAILELLAMLRRKSYKNKKDKDTVRALQNWLSLQFNAPNLDFTSSQGSVQPSMEPSVALTAHEPSASATSVKGTEIENVSAVLTEDHETEMQPAARGTKGSSVKTSTTSKGILARATPEPQLPPPSGVARSPTHAAVSEPASLAKPAPRISRGQGKKAAAATAEAKLTKQASAPLASEPSIALTPSSPMIPSPPQSSQKPSTRLRAPSESSEAELATSPMLSAVPRASCDMDVDELPPNTSSQLSTAEEQPGEREGRTRLADHIAAENASSSRSRSASITSSDTSHGGLSSDEESDADSDAEAATVKGGRKGAAKQAKSALGKALHSPQSKRMHTVARNNDASSSTDTGSSDSETESEPDTSKKSGPSAKSGVDDSSVETPNSSKTTKVLPPPPTNPFLRGLTPLSSRRGNGLGSVQKSTPFTRLSELKPASLRQNLSQPGSPLSTGGSTPLSASAQTPFFASQPIPVSNGNTNGSSNDSATFTTATSTPEPGEAESASDDDDVDSDSSVSSSSDEEGPKRRVTPPKVAASAATKRAGQGVGAKTAKPAAAKKRKSVFDVFGKSR